MDKQDFINFFVKHNASGGLTFTTLKKLQNKASRNWEKLKKAAMLNNDTAKGLNYLFKF